MTVSDIRLSVNFFSDMKIVRLQATHEFEGVAGLLKIWIFAATHCASGVLDDISDDEILFISGVRTKGFLDTLIKLNLLKRDKNNTLRIVNWDRHQTWVMGAPKRSEKALKAAQARWNKTHENGGIK